MTQGAADASAGEYVLLIALVVVGVVGSLLVIRKAYVRSVTRLMRSSPQAPLTQLQAERPASFTQSIDIPVLPLPRAREPSAESWLTAAAARRFGRTAIIVGCLFTVALAQAITLLAFVDPGRVSLRGVAIATTFLASPSMLGWLLARWVAQGRPTELGIWAGLALGLLSGAGMYVAVGTIDQVRAWLWLLALAVTLAAAYVVLLGSAALLRVLRAVARLSPEAIGATLACFAATAFWTLNPIVFEGNVNAWAYVVPGASFPALLVLAVAMLAPVQTGGPVLEPSRPPRLLFLRTFGHAKRSDRLLRGVSRHWLEVGQIDLVAGPDLAASVVTVDKLVLWLSGRLRGTFIANADDFARANTEKSGQRYRDGLYPVREFSCFESGWREVVTQLAKGASVVVMDLRSFTPDNLGCVFEIRTLLQTRSAGRTVFLVDGSTDLRSLQAVLSAAWHEADGRSGGARPVPRVYQLPADSKMDFRGVVATALGHAATL